MDNFFSFFTWLKITKGTNELGFQVDIEGVKLLHQIIFWVHVINLIKFLKMCNEIYWFEFHNVLKLEITTMNHSI
jgi:hypothetical protein